MSRLEPLPIAPTHHLTGISGDTLIRTACGFRHAQHMREGDLVVTRDHGLQPVRFVFRVSLAEALRISPEHAALRITPRAVGPMMPATCVTLAPDQRILMPAYLLVVAVAGPAALISARALGGSSDAVWRDRTRDGQPFYNLIFDRHEVISASGLWIDSYRPDAERLAAMPDDLRETLIRRYPQLREKRAPFPACAYASVPADAYAPGAA